MTALEAWASAIGWIDGDLGHGRAYRVRNAGRPRHRALLRDRAGTRRRRSCKPGAEEPGPALSRRAAATCAGSTTSTCWPRRRARPAHFLENGLGMRTTEQIVLDSGVEAGAWLTCTNKTYDIAFTKDNTGTRGPLPPRHLRRRQPRGHPARGRHLPRERRPHRDRAAQARGPADLLPLRLRARRQPRRDRQCRRAADARAGLEADRLDRGRAEEGPGVGAQDHRDLPHPRHAAGGLTKALRPRWKAGQRTSRLEFSTPSPEGQRSCVR